MQKDPNHHSAGGSEKLSGRPAIDRRTIGKTWTIGQETSTHGQDGNRLREAKFVTGRDGTSSASSVLRTQPNLPRIPEAWRASRLAQIGSRTVTYRFGQ